MTQSPTSSLWLRRIRLAFNGLSAAALGLESALGVVEAGRLADLIILGSDPTDDIRNARDVQWVVKGGHVHRLDTELEQPR